MIRTFEDLFEKLRADGRCRTVPEDAVKKVKRDKFSVQEMEAADRAMNWMIGYLFCLMDEGYIQEDEKKILVDLLLEMRYE